MKLSTLLSLPAALASLVLASSTPSGDYSEHLHLKPLPGGHLYAGFNFTATTSLHDYQSQHFRYFPRSLAQILQHSHTAELHLRFALGRWDEESWGSRPRDGRREGGTGVEIWAWVEGGDDGGGVVEERWSSLVNSLSGLFCASLNFIDGTKTTRPVLSFDPEGTHREGGLQLLHGTLPHEVVCTENLTPFLKLLPCKGKAGISSLLDGHKVFDANWQTMSVDVRPVCRRAGTKNPVHETVGADRDGTHLGPFENEDCHLEIQQTVDMVLDIERSMRPRDDPIPRPPSIEAIECDDSKSYNGQDTCYPKPREGDLGWSLSKIFGQPVRGSCHLDGAEDAYDISLEVPVERPVVEISPATGVTQMQSDDGDISLYILPNGQDFDISFPNSQQSDSTVPHQQSRMEQPPLHANRQITGYGQERGGMHTTLRNPHPYTQYIVYLESLPWFLRPYMHTLKVQGAKLDKMYYTPSIDRLRGSLVELLLVVPPQGSVEITYGFEKAVLRYTEYPPDANRGFDVAPAVIRVLPTPFLNESGLGRDCDGQGCYLRTTSLLLPLPTPDFSMPYNVIILTSTVIALGFGSIFNLLVRRFVLAEEVPTSPLAGRLKLVVARVREVGFGMRGMMRERLNAARGGSEGEKVGDGGGGGGGGGGAQEASTDGMNANGGLKVDGGKNG